MARSACPGADTPADRLGLRGTEMETHLMVNAIALTASAVCLVIISVNVERFHRERRVLRIFFPVATVIVTICAVALWIL